MYKTAQKHDSHRKLKQGLWAWRLQNNKENTKAQTTQARPMGMEVTKQQRKHKGAKGTTMRQKTKSRST